MRKFVICAAVLALAACGGDSGTVETEDGTVAYDTDGGGTEMRLTDDEGNETIINSGSNVDVDLPAGFTVYPGAEVASNTVMNGAQGQGNLVIMTSSASTEDMVTFYKQQAETAGIDIQLEMNTADSRMIGGEGPNGLFVSFNASESENGETTGMLTVGRDTGN